MPPVSQSFRDILDDRVRRSHDTQTPEVKRSRKKAVLVYEEKMSAAHIPGSKASVVDRLAFAGLQQDDIDVAVLVVSSRRREKDGSTAGQDLGPARDFALDRFGRGKRLDGAPGCRNTNEGAGGGEGWDNTSLISPPGGRKKA